MPISVTCQCGARLEIDEKFLGKEIPCPDCQRPLPTKAPPTPPPLDLPNHRKKSGLAVMSLTLALVGACIPIASIAAIVTGIFALKQIAKSPSKLEGAGFARAGIIVAGVCLFLTAASLASPYVLGVDQLLREFALSPRLNYTTDDGFFKSAGLDIQPMKVKRPHDTWAKWMSSNYPEPDVLILANTREDAFFACLNAMDTPPDPLERQKRIIDHVFKSELMLSVLGRNRASPNRDGIDPKAKASPDGQKQEIMFDVYVGGRERRFLIQFPAKGDANLRVVVAVARPGRFDRLENDFREMIASIDK